MIIWDVNLAGIAHHKREPGFYTITEPPFCNWTLLDFSCPFLILPSLCNYRDIGEMSLCMCLKFYLRTFFIVIACRRFWSDFFLQFYGNAPSRRIQSPMVQYQNKSGWNQNKDAFCALMERRMKILVAVASFTPPPSKIIKLWQLCSDLSRNL